MFTSSATSQYTLIHWFNALYGKLQHVNDIQKLEAHLSLYPSSGYSCTAWVQAFFLWGVFLLFNFNNEIMSRGVGKLGVPIETKKENHITMHLR
jgi:hypothetical protein